MYFLHVAAVFLPLCHLPHQKFYLDLFTVLESAAQLALVHEVVEMGGDQDALKQMQITSQ